MTPQEAENLLARYVAQQCTQDEENLVNSWLNKVLEERKFPESFSMDMTTKSEDWEKLIAEKNRRMPVYEPRTRSIIRPAAVATAIAAVAIGIVALVYYQPFTKVRDVNMAAANKDTTITHQKKDFKTVLPDGSIVYLNGASKLRYPKGLTDKERNVFLEGEAYFEVRADRNRPFIVSCSGQQLQVIGTHFNVRSYNGEDVVTTLVEGAVKVTNTRNKNQEIRLQPGDQSTLNAAGFEVKQVDPNSVISWKNEFVFNETPLKTALKELARWYDVGVDSSRMENVPTLDAVYGKEEPLPKLLKEISRSTKVNVLLRNNVITVE
ncbi:FecR family protein [Chitinophaga sancti]|uniref:FecR family protein n=1 Tax=Chitinophaga sancti TaxID=1004 RepID=UPI003F78B523